MSMAEHPETQDYCTCKLPGTTTMASIKHPRRSSIYGTSLCVHEVSWCIRTGKKTIYPADGFVSAIEHKTRLTLNLYQPLNCQTVDTDQRRRGVGGYTVAIEQDTMLPEVYITVHNGGGDHPKNSTRNTHFCTCGLPKPVPNKARRRERERLQSTEIFCMCMRPGAYTRTRKKTIAYPPVA